MTGSVHFKTSDELGKESIVHFRAKLITVVSERGMNMYICMINKFTVNHMFTLAHLLVSSVFLFSDKPDKEIFLYL